MMQGQKIPDKKKIEIGLKVCEAYATGEYTLESCCRSNGISYRTFRNWIEDLSDLSEAYKKAQEEGDSMRNERLRELAVSAIERRIQGETIEEETIIYEADRRTGKPKIKSRKVVKKHIQPSDTLIQVALYNRDPANWRNTKYHEHTGADGGPIEVVDHHFVFPDDGDEEE